MSSERPVYMPRRNNKNHRKRQRHERFHGAFTGGFSAGYFNTVGSKEGWTSGRAAEQADGTETTAPRRPQRPQDFMDDQDHDEWGGPTRTRMDFETTSNSKPKSVAIAKEEDELFGLAVIAPPQNVGNRLLRLLGWREGGSTAYVPTNTEHEPHGEDSRSDDDKKEEEEVHRVLSQKRLRKIQLQQQKHARIPEPKLDTCGLGYEPYKDAPEFERYREKRRNLARQKAQGVDNTYRVSHALGIESRTGRKSVSAPEDGDNAGGPYISSETLEDFVGTKSVGGFALQEDADDAYDDDEPLTRQSGKVPVNRDDLATEAYEHQSDDEGDRGGDSLAASQQRGVLGAALSSWARSEGREASSSGLTTDGRPPLRGFTLGIASLPNQTQRFRGPDLPQNYELRRHVFGPNEHPLVFKALSHAEQLQVSDARRKAAMDEALQSNEISTGRRVEQPLAGQRFSGLSTAMESRFTSSKTETKERVDAGRPSGLSHPSSEPSRPSMQDDLVAEKDVSASSINLSRTVTSFYPEPLLCKRFGVPARPKSHDDGTSVKDTRTKEQAYFEDEILSKVQDSKSAATGTQKDQGSSGGNPQVEPLVLPQLPETADGGVNSNDRPSIDIYKAIFDPDSEKESDDEEGDEGLPVKDAPGQAEARGRGTGEPNGRQGLEKKDSADSKVAAAARVDERPGHPENIVRSDSRNGKPRKRSPSESSTESDRSEDARKRRRKEDRRERKRRKKHRSDKKKSKKRKSKKGYR